MGTRGPLAAYQRRGRRATEPAKATPRQDNPSAAWEAPSPAAFYSAAASSASIAAMCGAQLRHVSRRSVGVRLGGSG